MAQDRIKPQNGMMFHGGGLDVAIGEYGGDKADWLDLSTGINSNPYPVYGVDLLSWSRLPDTNATKILINAARKYYKTDDESGICAANGTQAIIDLLPSIFECKRVGIISPTYNEHAHVWAKSGAQIIETKRGEELPNDLDALVVVNPNNPDGSVYEKMELVGLSNQMKKTDGIMIVDEAFCDTSPELSIVDVLPKNAIVLKSFGKFFGLAGLRLGFAVASPLLIEKISNHIGRWSVSGPALQIGARAFADANWINYAIIALKVLSKKQADMLQHMGLKVEGVNPLFIYASHEKADRIYEELLKNKILVRPFERDHSKLRFGICANNENIERLENSLKEAMKNV